MSLGTSGTVCRICVSSAVLSVWCWVGSRCLKDLTFVSYFPKVVKVIPKWYCCTLSILLEDWGAAEHFSWRRAKSQHMWAIPLTSWEGQSCRAGPFASCINSTPRRSRRQGGRKHKVGHDLKRGKPVPEGIILAWHKPTLSGDKWKF